MWFRAINPAVDPIELARKIAKARTAGRPYRDDVVADALLAVAHGITDRAGLERACRRSERREWAHGKRTAPLADHSTFHAQAPEAAKVPLYEALSALSNRQYQAIVLTYWEGMTQQQCAEEMRITDRAVRFLLVDAINNLRSRLPKMPLPEAVSK